MLPIGMSPGADLIDAVIERLDRIEARLSKVENEFAKWSGAAGLAKFVLGILGFAGVVWLIQMAANAKAFI